MIPKNIQDGGLTSPFQNYSISAQKGHFAQYCTYQTLKRTEKSQVWFFIPAVSDNRRLQTISLAVIFGSGSADRATNIALETFNHFTSAVKDPDDFDNLFKMIMQKHPIARKISPQPMIQSCFYRAMPKTQGKLAKQCHRLMFLISLSAASLCRIPTGSGVLYLYP